MTIRKQIPFIGWYNASLIHSLADTIQDSPDQTVSEFYRNFKTDQLAGQEFPLKNQSLTLGLLYVVLVVPREIWEKDKFAGTGFTFTTKHLFSIEEGSCFDNWDFLRLLRNAVSHANFDITSDGEYTFWNKKHDSDINFKIKILHSDLFTFINEISKYYLIEVAKPDLQNRDQ